MAIEYTLTLKTTQSPEEISHLFTHAAMDVGAVGPNTGPDLATDVDGLLLHQGIWTRVTAVTHHPMGHPVEDNFGFLPTVNISFRLNSEYDSRRQQDEIMGVTNAILAANADDAVFHSQYDTVWFVRTDHKLKLNSETDVWRPELLTRLQVPYEWAVLEFTE